MLPHSQQHQASLLRWLFEQDKHVIHKPWWPHCRCCLYLLPGIVLMTGCKLLLVKGGNKVQVCVKRFTLHYLAADCSRSRWTADAQMIKYHRSGKIKTLPRCQPKSRARRSLTLRRFSSSSTASPLQPKLPKTPQGRSRTDDSRTMAPRAV